MDAGEKQDPYRQARERMVEALRSHVSDERVLDAFRRVPRELFVPPELRARAYNDAPLPIGQGQTISQPLVVAIMLELLALKGDEKVLDVGTGSGYQAALLSLLARQVVTVERLAELALRAERLLAELKYENVSVHLVGEALGWPADAPYDAIVVAAAAPRVPDALVSQLKQGGRMVLPVGGRQGQQLVLVEKTGDGTQVSERGSCRFVPLIGKEAFSEAGWSV